MVDSPARTRQNAAKEATGAGAGNKAILGFVAKSLSAWSRRPPHGNVNGGGEKATKNTYNYASFGCAVDDAAKTPMCRVAEIARYNKLKHEYVLMDENGPAHMKYFTVKLVLCDEQEYYGEGTSIRKAQQAAAEVALQHTDLKGPPARRRAKSEYDPVVLLHQLAYQLDLTIEYQQEVIRVPIKENHAPNRAVPPLTSLMTRSSPIMPMAAANLPSAQTKTFQPPRAILPYTMGIPPPPPLIAPRGQTQCGAMPRLNPYSMAPPPPGAPGAPLPGTHAMDGLRQMMFHHQMIANDGKDYGNLGRAGVIYNNRGQLARVGDSPIPPTIGYNMAQRNGYSMPPPPPPPFFPLPQSRELSAMSPDRNPLIIPSSVAPPHPLFHGAIASAPPPPLLAVGGGGGGRQQTPTMPPPTTQNGVSEARVPLLSERESNAARMKNFRVYRTTLRLSDGSKHVGTAAERAPARANAAIEALVYLRPALEKLQAQICAAATADRSIHVGGARAADKKLAKLAKGGGDEKRIAQICADFAEKAVVAESRGADAAAAGGAGAAVAGADAAVAGEDAVSAAKADAAFSGDNSSNASDNNDEDEDGGDEDDDEDEEEEEEEEEADDNEDTVGSTTMRQNDDAEAPRKKKKSIISLVHECAIQLRMNVEFENLPALGQPHSRQFIVRCRFVSPRTAQVVEADGRGSSKKWAKQNACQMIYEKVKGLERDPVYLASLVVRKSRKTPYPYQSKTNKRKILVKQRRCDPQYGQWVNPVCRLMQVMQTEGKPDPVFKLLGEQGHSKYREFVVRVTCSDLCVEGVGQNKRLAKRAAADAMLHQLGYAKQMPQPGKSLLKRGKDEQQSMEISVFDPNDVSPFADDVSEKSFCLVGGNGGSADAAAETFADVEELLKVEEISNDWIHIDQRRAADSSPGATAAAATVDDEPEAAAEPRAESASPQAADAVRKRRVTFSNQVSACPPPDDVNYPAASIAPLKSEVLFVSSKLRKRGRDSKKVLAAEEKRVLASVTKVFLNHRNRQQHSDANAAASATNDAQQSIAPPTDANAARGGVDAVGEVLDSSKKFLDVIAKTHKFSVIYSDFPKAEDSPSDKKCFSLVTLGIDKPVVCPGSGRSEDEAHEDAAHNAIKELSQLSNCD